MESPSPAEASDKQTHTQQTAKKNQKKKPAKKQKKKSVQKKNKVVAKKTQTKTTAKKTDAVQTTKTPVAAPKSAAAPHAQPAHQDPGATTPAASAAPPAVETAPMAGSLQPPTEVKKEDKDAGSVVQQLAQPVKREVAPGNTSAKSPAPESVAGLLNRSQTDQFQKEAVQKMVIEQVQAHLPSPCCAPPSPGPSPSDNPRIRNRDKNAHARRMRFYRSLESFLDPTMNAAYKMKSFLVQRTVWDMTWSMLPPSDPD